MTRRYPTSSVFLDQRRFFEYSNREGEEFGKQRIENLVRLHRQVPLEELRLNLCEAVRVFAAGSPQQDDMTVVLARRNLVAAAAIHTPSAPPPA